MTFAFESRDAQFQPYLVGGFGTTFAVFGESEYTVNAGGGLRFRYPNSKLALFAEARVSRPLDTAALTSLSTIAPVTVGVRVGF